MFDIDPTTVAREACPSDPSVVLAGLHWALLRSMKSRANGTLHLDSCRNARVNAQWFECQRECEYAQLLVIWGDVWVERYGQQRPAAGGEEGR